MWTEREVQDYARSQMEAARHPRRMLIAVIASFVWLAVLAAFLLWLKHSWFEGLIFID